LVRRAHAEGLLHGAQALLRGAERVDELAAPPKEAQPRDVPEHRGRDERGEEHAVGGQAAPHHHREQRGVHGRRRGIALVLRRDGDAGEQVRRLVHVAHELLRGATHAVRLRELPRLQLVEIRAEDDDGVGEHGLVGAGADHGQDGQQQPLREGGANVPGAQVLRQAQALHLFAAIVAQVPVEAHGVEQHEQRVDEASGWER
jgi:hypothetical protein